jgi:hypothetical protein
MATVQQQKAAEFWAQKRAAQPPPAPDPEPGPPAEDPSNGEARPLKQQSRAAQARWAGEAASDEDLRSFFEELDLAKAFLLYAQMRKNLEVAGKILNQRSNVPETQHCKICDLSLDEYKRRCRKNDWFLNRPHYHDGDRNIIDVDHFCSAACVSLENNRTQGVYGISDQGMLPSDNPQNHPREFPGQRRLTDHDRSPLRKS